MNNFWFESYREFFKGKKILLGITGSIAAFKAVDLVRYLKKCGAEVKVILTENATQFVTPLTFQTLSGYEVGIANGSKGKIVHIELAKWADLVLIAPATANVIAKLANGIADDLLTTEVLATIAPVYIAPAMNPTMLTHPATQKNLYRVTKLGYKVLDTGFGLHACGDEGYGRMLEPAEIIAQLTSPFCLPSNGKTALISMGPTRSYLDPVRFITNRSSGKMGAALAFAAEKQGYHVEIISGIAHDHALPLPKLAHVTKTMTSKEMADAVLRAFPKVDLFLSTAAVLDFEFPKMNTQKLKKDTLKSDHFKLEPTLDILKQVGAMKRKDQFVLGFAAETDQLLENAKKKLKAKNCDAVFVNPISAKIEGSTTGFESSHNQGFLVSAKRVIEYKIQNKTKLATEIMKAIHE